MATSIYIGPNDKKRGLRQYQIFTGEYPQHVADMLRDAPALAAMFQDFEVFVKGVPPGAPKGPAAPQPAPRLEPPILKR